MPFVFGMRHEPCCCHLVYLDDTIVYAQDFDEHLEWLKKFFERFCQAGLKLKPSKCFLLRPKVPHLGHVISAAGVSTDPEKTEAVKQWSLPSKDMEVRSFLGLASYYRRFIGDFTEIASPLQHLTAKTTEKYKWTPECDAAFCTLKKKLVSAPA